MERKEWQLSASAISCFKACPQRFCHKYVLGLSPLDDTESQRVGNVWHRAQEIMKTPADTLCRSCAKLSQNDGSCDFCSGTGHTPANMFDQAIAFVNKYYEKCPDGKDVKDWIRERTVIAYSLSGYNWRYSQDDCETVATELQFTLPIRNPETGAMLPDCKLLGKIDKILRQPNGILVIGEHKSTSKAIDADSTFWAHLRLAVQPNMYVYAVQEMQKREELAPGYNITSKDPLVSSCLYDVWHKPQIEPKKLTQSDSAAFVQAGEYMGEKFTVTTLGNAVAVNGEEVEIEPGKKEGTFAIRESSAMFGARLLADIAERPDYYFARREVPRLDKDVKAFEYEIYNIYQVARNMDKRGLWFKNEQQCEATFKCPYTSICYNDIDVTDGSVPSGFKKREDLLAESEPE